MPKDMRQAYENNSSITLNEKTGEIIINGETAYLYEDYPDIIWFK